jgi:hypothetical protein
MTLGLKHKFVDGVFYLTGAIDEHVKLDSYINGADPAVRWNLRGITQINSLGIRILMKFLKELGPRPVEFYDCPAAFLEAANMVPSLVTAGPGQHFVKSIYLPMSCGDMHQFNASVPVKDIALMGDGVSMPIFDCPTCKMPLEPEMDIELEDLLFFLFD